MGFDKLHKSIVDLKNGFLEKLSSLSTVCQNIPSLINGKIGELNSNIEFWLDTVVTWFENLNTNLSSWFNSVIKWLTDIKNAVYNNFKDFTSCFVEYMEAYVSNILNLTCNIFYSLRDFVTSVGNWFTDLFSNLGEWFTSVGEWIAELPQKIADLFKELFIFLFVPEDNPFLVFKDLITSKFPIVNQIKELTDLLLGFSYGDEPIFTFTYNDIEFPIIDLTPFNNYKVIINSIIVAICYFMFFMKLIKMLPSLIRGL